MIHAVVKTRCYTSYAYTRMCCCGVITAVVAAVITDVIIQHTMKVIILCILYVFIKLHYIGHMCLFALLMLVILLSIVLINCAGRSENRYLCSEYNL